MFPGFAETCPEAAAGLLALELVLLKKFRFLALLPIFALQRRLRRRMYPEA